jgi:N-acetylmuramoyl-L-alanine amidase
MRVCLDPGHQKSPDSELEQIAPDSSVLKARCAPGTYGSKTGIAEHTIALEVALLLKTAIASRGGDVVLTRSTSDVHVSNIERAQFANQSGADFCVKIHCNGVRNLLRKVAFWKRGSMTLIPADEEPTRSIFQPSLRIARILHERMLEATRFIDLGIHTRTDVTGFNWSTIPVVLLELGYLTNSGEERSLVNETFQRNLTESLATAIMEARQSIRNAV